MENAIYLAGRVSRTFELRKYADELEKMGYISTSQWLWRKGHHANRDMSDRLHRGRIAHEDLLDIRKADIICLFSEEPNSGTNGGRMFEFGYSMGRHKKLWLVGPFENLFLCLPGIIQFKEWEDLVPYAKAYCEELQTKATDKAARSRTVRDAPDA
jgi:hypothetical protein